ncbi:hypothetical protein SISNIDRAFT_450798 [Sistotremastrum niveocremeum HHB9708]|uniref:Uncharacterized protein n=2 Tax=Sistotremastraceae TaxID=3402574 RepID=A0A164YKF9_9AGAM|nr:hypothetical protein SISNIDRAFT_450798 [Sistotremastrum niveocremeum HHB9708]KZT43421.1 hypothetical protein SISSUDRAFT_1040450 [Sistotremastrum suecicum HHB10207 ss-3]
MVSSSLSNASDVSPAPLVSQGPQANVQQLRLLGNGTESVSSVPLVAEPAATEPAAMLWMLLPVQSEDVKAAALAMEAPIPSKSFTVAPSLPYRTFPALWNSSRQQGPIVTNLSLSQIDFLSTASNVADVDLGAVTSESFWSVDHQMTSN